ncbi:DNA alkylation response protein, partial [Pseudomonas aeruginosa]
QRTYALAEHAAQGDHAELARQAASLLYHAVSMAALRWEAAGDGLASRALLADQVLQHRLAPRDPYAIP